VSVPSSARPRFFAAAVGAAITFALFGLITSLAPSFLAETLHEPSRALAGAVSFAMFAAAALAQTLTGARPPQQLVAAGIPALLTGTALLTVAVLLPTPSFGLFAAGDLIAGAGAGLMFKGAIGTVSEISLPESRAEALAGLYLAAYLGLSGPVIGLGALTQVASTRVSLLVFSGLLALGIFVATSALLGSRGHGTTKLGAQEDEQSVAAIRRALELGVNWIDTAAYGFGHSEEIVGRALDGLSERPYVFTKASLLEDRAGGDAAAAVLADRARRRT
jgi:MFS family permease